MPILEKIVISDFRNVELQEIEFSPNINCISGNNGEGKTNLLDAIHYMSMTKSAFASSDRYVLRHGAEEFALAGTYLMENGTRRRFALKMTSKGEKKVKCDDKPYQKISEHIGVLPVVMVSPADVSMVSESGEERRRFVNAVLSQMSKEYMASMQQYNRLLMQRNRMLKDMDPDRSLLEVIDMRLSSLAGPIYDARKKFVEDLRPVVSDYYRMLSGDSEQVDIRYETRLDEAPLEELLARSYEKDKVLKHTTEGIHRDDFAFTMNGHPIRRYGSQGQQKSFLVSLKFAQYEIMKKNYDFAPILLLDDVFDKLDMGRISNLHAIFHVDMVHTDGRSRYHTYPCAIQESGIAFGPGPDDKGIRINDVVMIYSSPIYIYNLRIRLKDALKKRNMLICYYLHNVCITSTQCF